MEKDVMFPLNYVTDTSIVKDSQMVNVVGE
jgi:hypothetical protein